MSGLLAAAASGLITWAGTPVLAQFLTARGIQAVNFRGRLIPVGAGMIIPVAAIPAYAVVTLAHPDLSQQVMAVAVVIIAAALVGFVDDVAGEGEPKGFRGHARAFRKGKLTAGGIKVVGIGAASFLASLSAGLDLEAILLALGLIPLGANAFNSLDLRPGRAGKVFLAASTLLVAAGLWGNSSALVLILPMVGGLVGYLRWDLKGKVMMGDTGANALGAALGAVAAFALPQGYRVVLLTGLLALHVFTERYSLSRILEGRGAVVRP